MLFQHTAGHPRVETDPNLYHFNISTLLHHIPYAAPAAVNNTGRFGGGRMESDQMKTKTKSPWYNHIEEWILAICFGLMTAIVGVNVVLRAFNHSLSWADQAARILFVWCTLIGISLGAFTGQHLKVEAIDNFLPRKITYWIDLFGDFVSFVYAIVVSYMEVKKIGVNADGMDVFIDKNAAEADGIIVNCRIKPHTSFRGPFESGIMKMMTIGLGKQVGAETCHRAGFKYMAKYVPMFGQAIIENAPILFAVATIENAYDQTAELVTVDAPDVYEQEPILLQRAFANMPRILVDSCELLIVDECGKYFSGNGMDPNVSGKFPTPYASGGIESQHIVALDIDEASHGNAQGLGLASATTVRAVKKLDLDAMYVNGITCKMLYGCEIPPFMNNDREAIQMGLAMCVDYDEAHPRIVRIPNTLHLERIMLSEAYYDEVRRNPNLIIESEPAPLAFDADGNLAFDLDNAP